MKKECRKRIIGVVFVLLTGLMTGCTVASIRGEYMMKKIIQTRKRQML